MTPALKPCPPCPFCGGTRADMGIFHGEGVTWCPDCNARAPWAVWNKRSVGSAPKPDEGGSAVNKKVLIEHNDKVMTVEQAEAEGDDP